MTAPRVRPREAELLVWEVEHFAGYGYDAAEIASRLGYGTTQPISLALHRAGRPDLWEQITGRAPRDGVRSGTVTR